MSHNKIKVAGQEPDASGEISLDLNDLSNVTVSSPLLDQVLEYNGSNFVNSGYGSFESDLKFGFVCNTSGWSSSAYAYSVNDYLSLRDYQATIVKDSGYDQNDSTGSNTPRGNTKWFESVDIPTAGKYLFIVTLASRANATAVWRMSNNAGLFGSKCYIHNDNIYGSMITGIADCVQNDIFRVVLLEKTGSLALFTSSEMRCTSTQIYKIG